MKNRFLVCLTLFSVLVSTIPTFSATVLKEKEDAALFKKDSIYSEVGVEETTVASIKSSSAFISIFCLILSFVNQVLIFGAIKRQ